jgi:hypothetical protein
MRVDTRAGGKLRGKWGSEEEKSKLVSKRRKMQEMMREEEIYHEATGLCFFGRGTPIFCLFIFSTRSSWGLTPCFLPMRVPVGGPWFKGESSTTSSSRIAGDDIAGRA